MLCKTKGLLAGICILLVIVGRVCGGQSPQDEDYGKVLYVANNIKEAFEYCGVDWMEMDEKCETSNYNHCRNSTKKHYIAMFKPVYEGDRYFFVGKGDDYWLVRRKPHKENGVYSLPWGVYKIYVDDDKHPATKLFHEMLYEFMEEVIGKHHPDMDENGKKSNNKKDLKAI